MDRELVRIRARWSLQLQVDWRNDNWLSHGLSFKHKCKCGICTTVHSVHQRDSGFYERETARRNRILPVFPDFIKLMFDCRKWFARSTHVTMSTRLVCKDLRLHRISTTPNTQCPKQKTVFTCLVLTLFSLSCLCRALTIDCIWVVRRFTGLKHKNKSTVHVY